MKIHVMYPHLSLGPSGPQAEAVHMHDCIRLFQVSRR